MAADSSSNRSQSRSRAGIQVLALALSPGRWRVAGLALCLAGLIPVEAGEKIHVDQGKRIELPGTRDGGSVEPTVRRPGDRSAPNAPTLPYIPPSSGREAMDPEKLRELMKGRGDWMFNTQPVDRDEAIRQALGVRKSELDTDDASRKEGRGKSSSSSTSFRWGDSPYDKNQSGRSPDGTFSLGDSTQESSGFFGGSKSSGLFGERTKGESEDSSELSESGFLGESSRLEPIRTFRLNVDESGAFRSTRGASFRSSLGIDERIGVRGSALEGAENQLEQLFSGSARVDENSRQGMSESLGVESFRRDAVQQLLDLNLGLGNSGRESGLVNNSPDRTREPIQPITGSRNTELQSSLKALEPIGRDRGLLDSLNAKTLGGSSLSPAIIVPSSSRPAFTQPPVLELPKRRF